MTIEGVSQVVNAAVGEHGQGRPARSCTSSRGGQSESLICPATASKGPPAWCASGHHIIGLGTTLAITAGESDAIIDAMTDLDYSRRRASADSIAPNAEQMEGTLPLSAPPTFMDIATAGDTTAGSTLSVTPSPVSPSPGGAAVAGVAVGTVVYRQRQPCRPDGLRAAGELRNLANEFR